ncbi:MAG TPA: glycine C-acetyltransferase [Ramlibacter sp.]|nr:glycine C-acetyltransferase [Ramlibacter sp.]
MERKAAALGTRVAARPMVLSSAQGGVVIADGARMINMSSNNYLDLANAPAVRVAATQALAQYGLGLASVRFLSGTHDLHLKLEQATGELLHTEDCIAFGSCFDANAGIFEALLDEEDRILSDELNHASIIDGARLSKAARLRYRHRDLEDLERQLRQAPASGVTMIVTDGVFSMDGSIAPLPGILQLARQYGALVMVDDSHAIGALGATGRGCAEFFDVLGQVDLITGTYGKALGGAMGGFAAGRCELIELLRARARPYLFSNPIPPSIAAGVLAALRLMQDESGRLQALHASTNFLRTQLEQAGLEVLPGQHPITPVMLRSSDATRDLVTHARSAGVLVSGIEYPVVAKGQERIRLQVNAGHSREDLSHVVHVLSQWHRARAAA